MTPDTLLWVYLIGIPIAWIPCSLPFVESRDAEDVGMAVGLGLCFAFMWPFVPPALLVYAIVKSLVGSHGR